MMHNSERLGSVSSAGRTAGIRSMKPDSSGAATDAKPEPEPEQRPMPPTHKIAMVCGKIQVVEV